MDSRIVASLLELGDATSRNLEFSHRDDIFVSYGEETITETNLLELRRRHPDDIRLEMFSKPQEARNGADWEWHIVGRRRTIKMRVQAKRLQCNGVLRVKHVVKSSGSQQRDLLIRHAQAENMKPVYCIYSSEQQRAIWKQDASSYGLVPYETGCLLADAHNVPLATRRLCEVEDKCIPWHFLFDPSTFSYTQTQAFFSTASDDSLAFVAAAIQSRRTRRGTPDSTGSPSTRWRPPTIDDLNGDSEDTGRPFDPTGVTETSDEDRERTRPETAVGQRRRIDDIERLRDRGIHRMLVMDVQDDFGFPRRDARRRR